MAGAGCGGRGEDLECVHEDVGMLGFILGGRCSGICGGTSYGDTSNPSVAWKIWTYNMNTVKL